LQLSHEIRVVDLAQNFGSGRFHGPGENVAISIEGRESLKHP
jgi:hypothetical protein